MSLAPSPKEELYFTLDILKAAINKHAGLEQRTTTTVETKKLNIPHYCLITIEIGVAKVSKLMCGNNERGKSDSAFLIAQLRLILFSALHSVYNIPL